MPTVSFVVPSLDQGPFLRRCLEGCLAQGVPGAEILVQDGGSSDETLEILRAYGNRVSWVSRPDGGQADAVNQAVGRARGEVIAWINADDCYAGPGALAPLLELFDSDAAVDVAYGEALVVDAAGRPLRPYRTRLQLTPREILLAPQGPSQPATLFRRRTFVEAGGLRTDLFAALDYELWVRLFARARRVRRLPQLVAWMTAHPGAKSIRAMGRQIREVASVKRQHARRLGLGAGDRARMAAGLAALYLYWGAVRLGLRRAA